MVAVAGAECDADGPPYVGGRASHYSCVKWHDVGWFECKCYRVFTLLRQDKKERTRFGQEKRQKAKKKDIEQDKDKDNRDMNSKARYKVRQDHPETSQSDHTQDNT